MGTIRYTLGGDYDPNDSASAYIPGDYLPSDMIQIKFSDQSSGDFLFIYSPRILGRQIQGSGGELIHSADGINVDFSENTNSVALYGSRVGDILIGGNGRDTLDGGAGNDALHGGGGDDILIGGLGRNSLDGGGSAESNTVSYASYVSSGGTAGVSGSLETGFSDHPDNTRTFFDTLINVQNVLGSHYDDVLKGNAGDNVIEGGLGGDSIDGGGGNDTAGYASSYRGVTIDLATGAASGGDAEGDTLSDIDNLLGSANRDTLVGDALANTLTGGGSNDVLDGGAGADTLAGGLGKDIYYVDDAGDAVTELAGWDSGIDLVRTTLNAYTLSANVEQVVFAGTGAFSGTGNAGDNRLTGGTGDDRFFTDGRGSDAFGGGTGTDSVFYTKAATGAVIDLNGTMQGGAAAGDVYGSIEKFFGSNTAADTMTAAAMGRSVFSGQGGDDVLTGGDNIDTLLGGADDDTLSGGGAVDLLTGGLGDDVMDGGGGRDQFIFVEAKFGADTINNFEDGQDRLKVYSAVAGAITDFTISGSGTSHVVLTLTTDPTNTITLEAGTPITITAADFLFY